MEYICGRPLVGVDAEGAAHHFDQYHDIVYVVDEDGDLEHVEELSPGQLTAWIDYVADTRGWRDCRYVPDGGLASLAEQLAAQFESAQ